ncbi:MAG: hypothetical protein ACTSO2_17350 [Promethearchaeota archaeon]
MNWEIITILNLGITCVLGGLLLLFIYQTMQRKRKLPELLIGLVFGTLGGFLAFIESAEINAALSSLRAVFLSAHLTCYGFQLFFFYLFLESMININIKLYRFLIAFSFLFLQIISDWLIVWFNGNVVTEDLWLLADIGYNSLGIYTFLVVGLFVYIDSYKYMKERKPILLSIALLIIGSGYIILSALDYTNYFGVTPSWLSDISDLGDILPFTGILIFLITYLSDIDYIYRFPFDNYVLMVSYKYGLQIHSVFFETKRIIKTDVNLISGFLSSLNTVFTNVLEIEDNIEMISGKKAHIMVESGEYVTATIISKRINIYLKRSLKRYIREFESKFKQQLEENVNEINVFESAKELIKPVFPFLKVREI